MKMRSSMLYENGCEVVERWRRAGETGLRGSNDRTLSNNVVCALCSDDNLVWISPPTGSIQKNLQAPRPRNLA